MTGAAGAESVTGFVALVADLSEFLSAEVTLDEIADHLGGWGPGEAPDPASPLPTEVAATSPYVARANVAQVPGSDVPYAVTLVPTERSRPPVATMRAVLGEPRIRPAGPDQPTEIQFAAPRPRRGWQVAVVAWVVRRGPDLDRAEVSHLLLRRDRVT